MKYWQPDNIEHLTVTAEAFSRTAEKYDRFAEDHPNLARIRAKVYRHVSQYLKPGSYILELNAGTGTDAVYLARQGYTVHATDIAPGMIQRIEAKIKQHRLEETLTVQKCSFTALDQISGGPFDAVFSNLGGLNCLADLRAVTMRIPFLLKPGGLVTCVLMPPVCLWELALALTGNFRLAFRRLSPDGTLAHLEGMHFMIHYYTPEQVTQAFEPAFMTLAIEGLSVFAPPAESKNLAKRHPVVYRWLSWLDDRLADHPPFNRWGDFFIISLRYSP